MRGMKAGFTIQSLHFKRADSEISSFCDVIRSPNRHHSVPSMSAAGGRESAYDRFHRKRRSGTLCRCFNSVGIATRSPKSSSDDNDDNTQFQTPKIKPGTQYRLGINANAYPELLATTSLSLWRVLRRDFPKSPKSEPLLVAGLSDNVSQCFISRNLEHKSFPGGAQ